MSYINPIANQRLINIPRTTAWRAEWVTHGHWQP